MNDERRKELLQKFDLSMERCYQAFGKYAFSKIHREGQSVRRNIDYMNKSLFSSFSVLLLNKEYDEKSIKAHQRDLLFELADTLEDYSYTNSITIGTGSKRSMNVNFAYSRKVLEKCLK